MPRNNPCSTTPTIPRISAALTSGSSLRPHAQSRFFFQAEDGIRHYKVTGVQTCALPILYVAQHRFDRGGPPQASPSSGREQHHHARAIRGSVERLPEAVQLESSHGRSE